MPITVSVPWDGTTNFIGPGMLVVLQSNFIGPLPTGSFFDFQIFQQPPGEAWYLQQQFDTTTVDLTFRLLVDAGKQLQDQQWVPKENDPLLVKATLNSPTAVLDSGQNNANWSLQWQAMQTLALSQQGTAEAKVQTVLDNQAQYMPQITDIHTDTPTILTNTNTIQTDTHNMVNTLFPQLQTPINYIQQTVGAILNGITATITTAAGAVTTTISKFFDQHSHDQFGVFNPTNGPTCANITWVAGSAAYWGATVNITSYPSEWTFTTPADDWSIRDLAVFWIEINGETQVRHGIHQLTFTVEPLPATFPAEIADIGIPVTPPNYTFHVDWAGGVCGELLLYYVPI